MRRLRCAASTIVALALLGAAGGLIVLYSGAYDIAATQQHGRIASWVLHTAAVHSIERRAKNIVVPDLSGQATLDRGLHLFRLDCVQCHGGPGVAPEPFAMGLTPGAPQLMQVGREWPVRDIYWTIVNGIKMTAMPAWRYRMPDSDIWAVVAFVESLPKLSPSDYKALADKSAGSQEQSTTLPTDAPFAGLEPGNAARGRTALRQYACDSCHAIPGINSPPGRIGPPLDGMGQRQYIAGMLANTPENMLLWIRRPQQVKPGTAMPDMGVAEQHGRDMVAYIESLR